jgi:hypothetical protein
VALKERPNVPRALPDKSELTEYSEITILAICRDKRGFIEASAVDRFES